MDGTIFPSISELSSTELRAAAVDNHTQAFVAAFHRFHRPIGPDFHEILSGMPCAFSNALVGIDVPDPESTVSAVTKRIRAMDIPAYWWVAPHAQPEDLGDMVLEEGWTGPSQVPVMCADIDGLRWSEDPPGFELKEVSTEEELALWRDLLAEVFTLPKEVTRLFGSVGDEKFRKFTGFIEGEPAGTSAIFLHDGIVGIYCVGTRIPFRGRGVGAGLTLEPLRLVRDQGFRLATLQASSMGYPVYKRLGFLDTCCFDLYSFGSE